MSVFKLSQKIVVVSLVTIFSLAGCGWIAAEAPASPDNSRGEVAQSLRLDKDSAVEEQPAAALPEEEDVDGAAAPMPAMTNKPGLMVGTAGDDRAETDFAAPAEAKAAMESSAGAAVDAVASAGPALSRDEVGSALESSEAIAPQQIEPLRAGEVDDNAQWDDYLLYRRNFSNAYVHDRDVSERYVVEVVDGQGLPLLGAEVRFYVPGQQRREIYRARTVANGQVLFHPLALDEPLEQISRFEVEVQKGEQLQQFALTRFNAQISASLSERWTATLDYQQPSADSLNLDLLFLVDATGSMADEINKIQSTIFDVSARIDALPERPDVRYGLVSYRDYEDSYVTRVEEFTPDVRDFAANLNTLFAEGGGDYPEALNEGLHEALHAVEWRGGDTVQLIFLIADAPPHLDFDRSGKGYDYALEMVNAAQRGIKIFPLASSGLDDQGEYVFRQLAQFTQGRFLFLTYQGELNGGAPGDDTTHHVDDYSVDNLDNLLVRLVQEELAFQNPQFVQATQ